MAATALERMKSVARKYQTSNDLMQSAANDEQHEVEVQEGQVPGHTGPKAPRRSTATSYSKVQASSVKHYNTANQRTINQHFVQSQDDQTRRMDKQIQLAQQQAITMRQLSTTMDEVLQELRKSNNKLDPKYQDFAGPGPRAGINGQPEGEGLISQLGDALGSALGGLGGLGDLLGGRGKNKGEKGKAGRPKTQRTPTARMDGGWLNRLRGRLGAATAAGGAALGGLGGALGRGGAALGRGGVSAIESLRGGGARGALLKGALAAGAAALGYAGYKGLGSISAGRESGTQGVHAISSGKGDRGGVSYGAHQLSSATGSMTAFLQSQEGATYAPEFAGMTPGSAAFNSKYAEIANRDEQGFAQAQENYIARTHYGPTVERVSRATGVNLGERGRAVQEMLYSTGVQYGPNSTVVPNALKGLDVANMSDADIITAVQDYKTETVPKYFPSSPNLWRGLTKRPQEEKMQLLAFNEQELAAKANGDDPAAQEAVASAEGVSAPQANALVNAAAPMAMPAMPAGTEAPGAPADNAVGVGTLAAVGGGGAALTGAELLMSRPTTMPSLAPGIAGAEAGAARTAANAAEGGLVRGAARTGARLLGPAANIGLGAYDAYNIVTDENATRPEKERALSETGGGMAGAAAGAAIGATAGSVVPIVGTAIGGIIGGGLGYWGGSEAAGAGYDAIKGSPEQQQANAAVSANAPFNGLAPLQMRANEAAAGGNQTASDAARAMATIDAVTQKVMAGLPPGAAQSVDAAKQAVTGNTEGAAKAAIAGAAASAIPQSAGDLATMAKAAAPTGMLQAGMGALGGLAGGLAELGLPEGWMSSIMGSYAQAQGVIGNAMSGVSGMTTQPIPGTAAAQNAVVTALTAKPNTPVAPSPAAGMPSAAPMAPAAAPMPVQATPTSSPANAAFYSDQDMSPQASAVAARQSPATVTSAQAATPAVASSGAATAPVEQQKYEPVKSVMMIEPKKQDTMMPDRFKPASDRIPASGVSESNSNRPTLDDAPMMISDLGLVLLQTGII